MSIPGNGIFVVRGELSTIMTAMRRTSRNSWNSYQVRKFLNYLINLNLCLLIYLQYDNNDSLSKSFNELKESALQIEDLKLLSPEVFLAPFLEAIRSEETTGPITSIALSAINKFLSYGLIGKLKSQDLCFNMLITQNFHCQHIQIQRIQIKRASFKISLTQLRMHGLLVATTTRMELCF